MHDTFRRADAVPFLRSELQRGRRKVYARWVSDHVVEDALRQFVEERQWGLFHSPGNLSKSIAIEAGELLECYQWNDEADLGDVRSELADVLTYCHLLAMKLGLDVDQIVLDKLEETKLKYPVEKARGRSDKYDRL